MGADDGVVLAAASDSTSPAKSDAVMHEMARKGSIEVVHVGDEHNPSDYLTKWLKKEKVERSVRYSSGAAHVP